MFKLFFGFFVFAINERFVCITRKKCICVIKGIWNIKIRRTRPGLSQLVRRRKIFEVQILNLNLSHAWIDPYQYFDIFELHLENLSFIGIKWGNSIYFIQEIIVNLSNPWTSGEPMIVWMPNQIKGIILILLNWYTSQCAACWLYNIKNRHILCMILIDKRCFINEYISDSKSWRLQYTRWQQYTRPKKFWLRIWVLTSLQTTYLSKYLIKCYICRFSLSSGSFCPIK